MTRTCRRCGWSLGYHSLLQSIRAVKRDVAGLWRHPKDEEQHHVECRVGQEDSISAVLSRTVLATKNVWIGGIILVSISDSP